ncbi:MAG: hypothetical protein H6Q65_971 [Firmicutes bacterium]|nr:hypothetical protein [Bacillota bacterium]
MEMELKAQMMSALINNLEYVMAITLLLLLVVLVLFVVDLIKMNRMAKRYKTMMRGMESANLEELLLAHIEELRQTLIQVKSLQEDCRRLDELTSRCLQKTNLVRYNAFENTGSDLSFALALLDAHNDGVVVSSLFGRDESRVYAKPIINSQSTYFLTEEEQQALRKAAEKK